MGFSLTQRERERARISIYRVEQEAFPWGKHAEGQLGLTPVLDPETGYSSLTKAIHGVPKREFRGSVFILFCQSDTLIAQRCSVSDLMTKSSLTAAHSSKKVQFPVKSYFLYEYQISYFS